MYEAYALIKQGKYINVYALLLNNDVTQTDIFKITNVVSTKNPKDVYQNKEGHRYNISKIAALYFNIVDDVIKLTFEKKEVLANIVNYILNDKVLLNHRIGKSKLDEYTKWYESIKDTLDEDLADEIRPERMNINNYNSDDKLIDAISVISHAIYNLRIIDVAKLPQEFKDMYKYYKTYNENYKEEKDIFEIGAAAVPASKLISITYTEAYDNFVKIVKHFEVITPNQFKELWEVYQDAYNLNEPSIFWDYAQLMVEDYEHIGYKLNELIIDEDSFEIAEFNYDHSNYIRARNKRWYDIENQDAEHFKMTLGEMDEYEEEIESMWGE